MSLPDSYAHGVRTPFRHQPPAVRAWVAAQLGGPVTRVRDCQGGFAPGTAAVVGTDDRQVFAKIASSEPNPASLQLYRDERLRLAALPDDPRIVKPLAATDLVCESETGAQTYAVTLFPALPGRTPPHPWSREDASRALDAWGGLAEVLAAAAGSPGARHLGNLAGTGGPVDLFGHWSAVLGDDQDPWTTRPWVRRQARWLADTDAALRDQCHGQVPAHCDLRADNIVTDRRQVFFVDWADARLAAPWVDPAMLACDVVISGADRDDGGTVAVWPFLLADPVTAAVGPERLGATVVGLAAALHQLSRRPAQPGMPTIRAWQSRCAERLLAFAQRRFEAKDLGRGPAR